MTALQWVLSSSAVWHAFISVPCCWLFAAGISGMIRLGVIHTSDGQLRHLLCVVHGTLPLLLHFQHYVCMWHLLLLQVLSDQQLTTLQQRLIAVVPFTSNPLM
jgi:hypothetical protein